ncbi:MAG TPA: LPS assembly protein LptD [Pyrinomonadaceae bacterium]|nr:LPS assembly protein LptD [Pyrinomonadaceae bacterium]
MRFFVPIVLALALGLSCMQAPAQQTNPVDRQVANPITDTPNINPVSAEQNTSPTKKPKTSLDQEGGNGDVVVYSEKQTVEGEQGSRILVYTGNVDVHYGTYRLQANKVTLYEAEDRMVAEGSVVFDEGDAQRITGAKAVWNLKTKLGTFEDSTGFTNQTNDGTVIYFTAEKVERTALDEVVITKGKFTACEEAVPKWSFTADQARIKINKRIKLKNAKFRVKDIPIIPVPFASLPIEQRDRQSGFLTPTFGFSGNKGLRLSGAYFQTLGRSADVTIRGDLYTQRGIGYGLDFRTRANSRSFFNFGFYAVKDRIFGSSASPETPDQGGSVIYAEGVQYFSNGVTAAADVRLTSNLAFRQVFSDGIQQIISPIEISQAFVNKSWNNYELNVLARSQVISIPNVRVKLRNLPSFQFEKRPSMISFLKPLYFSFQTSAEGVSRREEVDSIPLYQQTTGADPVITPTLTQRFDVFPELTLPINTKYFNFTATAAGRVTYYSHSFDDMRRIVARDVTRKYGQFQFDIRPVALAKNYYGKNDAFKFRHVIEPFVTYRFVKGVNNFQRIIRIDELDTITDTNELEFGLTNRFYTRRYSEAVTDEAQKRLADTDATAKKPLSVQPYEIFNLTVRGKYFFDKTFGGALIAGQRNQIEPITAVSFYTFGGIPRRFSPLNVDATYRPQRTVYVNTRVDFGLHGDGIRAASATIGYETPLLKFFQTLYYTRAVDLVPSLQVYANREGKEPGTLKGAQWGPSVFIGNRDHGLYGGTSFFFDFENRRASGLSPLISSLYTAGYAYDCCSLAVQFYTFNVGVRNENRLVFSFRLNGIGSFGTEQFGQGLR